MSTAHTTGHAYDHGAGARLHAHHVELDRVFEQLLDAYRGGDWDDVRAMWTRFERDVRAHMAYEEEHVLPVLARVSADEAAALRSEHETLRRLLGELGVGVDLHMVKDEVAAELVATIRAHAAREDVLAYRVADRELSGPALEAFEGVASEA